jgi:hypothetical protein
LLAVRVRFHLRRRVQGPVLAEGALPFASTAAAAAAAVAIAAAAVAIAPNDHDKPAAA